MKARKPGPLYRRVVWWLLGYLALLSLAVFSVGNYVHEHAEHAAWRALLNSELDSIVEHVEHEPHYRWQDSDTLSLYRFDAVNLPDALRTLHPGLHDGVMIKGRETAVMVRETESMGRVALVLDISDFHDLEQFATRWVMLAGVIMIFVTVLMASFGMERMVRPLSLLAQHIAALRPGVQGQRIEVDPRGSSELHTIADALNDYLDRNEQFVERERVFISTASHELRTPIAVMTGAAELALEQPGLPERARQQMQRVLRTAQSVEQLIELLLVLARDPARLAARAERIALDQLLPEIVDDHRHLRRQGPEHRYPGRAGGYRRADGSGAGGDRQPAAQCHREQRSRPYRTAAESVGGADPAGPRARHEPGGDRGDPCTHGPRRACRPWQRHRPGPDRAAV